MKALDHSISRPLESPTLTALSLGAGLQSSVLALMAHRGDLPKPDAAFFSDTGWESRATYRWLDWLESHLSFPVVRLRRGGPDLGAYVLQIAKARPDAGISAMPPFFTKEPDAQLPKQCNAEYKRDVVNRELGRLCRERGQRPHGKPIVEQWLGMTTDELERISKNRRKYIHNRWPLIEMRMSRGDCIRWLEERQYSIPPKSACIFCPYRNNASLKALEPEDFEAACAFDAAIRRIVPVGQAFTHRSLKPLAEVDLSEANLDLFGNECLGYCNT